MKRIIFLMILIASQAIGAVFSLEEVEKLKQNFMANIQPNGAIVASPSQQNPNYFYDWVRDAAISMNLIEMWYESTHSSEYKDRLTQYVSWSKNIQHQNAPLPGHNILGEPKFYVDGTPFDGPWGRPQNDGPALRASVLIHFSNQLLNQNEAEYVESNLYRNTIDPQYMGVIKTDLEYIAHHWSDENFDLWEEILGHHFFTIMTQQRALYEGATLARRLNDEGAATYYTEQANLIGLRLHQHLDEKNQLIQATLTPHAGPQKNLEVDTSVILAVLLNPQEGRIAPESIYVQNTIKALHEQFNLMFPINNNNSGPILFGRYPGDTYDGYQTNSLGNPWFILTATMAEYYYTLADNLPMSRQKQRNEYITTGDAYLELIKHYAPDMYLYEQINLNTGAQQGAKSLTWSYVAVLHALELRNKLAAKIK